MGIQDFQGWTKSIRVKRAFISNAQEKTHAGALPEGNPNANTGNELEVCKVRWRQVIEAVA